MELVERDGWRARIALTPGRPVLLTQRMAALDMNLWERVWPALAETFSVVAFELPVPDPADFADGRTMFRSLGERCVEIAESFGESSFHYLGWSGGASLGLHLLVDQPERLRSAVLFDLPYPGPDPRADDRRLDLLESVLHNSGLESYTWLWLLTSFTPAWVAEHYDEVAAMVQRRIQADAVRKLDADRVVRWLDALHHPTVTAAELAEVQTPVLLAATPANIHVMRRVQRLMPRAETAFVPSGSLAPYEAPDLFLAAVGHFLRAAAAQPAVRSAATERVATVERPARRGVVFLHGWLMSPDIWTHQLDAVAAAGIRAVALAAPGHVGEPAMSGAEFTLEDWADVTAARIRSLGLDAAMIVGHSMSGMLAIALAQRHPDLVRGLGLVGTTDEAWPATTREEFLAGVAAVAFGWSAEVAQQLATVLVGEDHRARTPAFIGAWTNEVATYDLPSMLPLGRAIAGRRDASDFTAALALPAVVIHGEDDVAIDPAMGRRLADRLGAPLVLVPGGHCCPLESPSPVSSAVLDLALKCLGDA